MPQYRKCSNSNCSNKIPMQKGSGGYCDECADEVVSKCSVAGCGNDVRYDAKKCAECREEREPNYQRTKRPDNEERLNRIQLKQQPACEKCGDKATDVDHIVPLREGGKDNLRNRQSLCKSCHSRKTAREVGFMDGAESVQSEPRSDDAFYGHQEE